MCGVHSIFPGPSFEALREAGLVRLDRHYSVLLSNAMTSNHLGGAVHCRSFDENTGVIS